MKKTLAKDRTKKTIEFPNGESEKAGGRKDKKTMRRATLSGFLSLVFITLYIPSLVNWLSGRQIARDVLRNGIIEKYIRCDAVIVRDEVLLEPSPIDGRCIAEIGEGEKTAAFSSVAMITNDESEEIFQQIENINKKIIKAQMGMVEQSEFFSEDLAKLDEEISFKIQNLIIACNSRNFEDIGKYRNEIGKIVENKAEIIGENSTESYISNLQRQKEALQAQLNKNTFEIKSNISGIVSYAIDGLEAVLNIKNVEELSSDQLDEIIKNNLQNESAESSGKVKAGLPVAKIIRGTDILLAAVMTKKDADVFKEGDRIKVRINGINLETTGTVVKKNVDDNGIIPDDGAGKCVVVVRISRGTDVLSAVRVVNADFVLKTEEGLKIPVKSIMDISADGSRGKIMLVKYNVATSRIVEIVCRDEEYAIIKTPENETKNTVSLYDMYIINPENIEEGEIIEK
mgnify:CR=1 FL=1